jgi:hypothetical protein
MGSLGKLGSVFDNISSLDHCPDVKMERTMEQRVHMTFWVKLQKSPTETLELLKPVYDESAMSQSSVIKWYKRFRGGREDVNDDEKQGAPLTKRTEENVAKIRERVRYDSGYLAGS